MTTPATPLHPPLLSSVREAVAWLRERVPAAGLLQTDSRQVMPGDAFIVTGNVADENDNRRARNIGEPILPETPFNFIDPLTGTAYNRAFAQILRYPHGVLH